MYDCPVDKKPLDVRREFVVEGISTDWFETFLSFSMTTIVRLG